MIGFRERDGQWRMVSRVLNTVGDYHCPRRSVRQHRLDGVKRRLPVLTYLFVSGLHGGKMKAWDPELCPRGRTVF